MADLSPEEDVFQPVSHEVLVGGECWADNAAKVFLHNGFCVLKKYGNTPLITPALCERCREVSLARLQQLLGDVKQRGLDPKRDRFVFNELCSRTPGGRRYDMHVPVLLPNIMAAVGAHDDACWVALHAAIDTLVRPVLEAAHFQLERLDLTNIGNPPDSTARVIAVDSAGCVISLPGAPDQHFHPDGTARGLVNVFVPLLSICALLGPTELQPGSHVWRQSTLGPEPRNAAQPISPLLQRGELLLFDYRTMHRGRANMTMQPRPIAYVVYSMRLGIRDSHNFPIDAPL
eukprot:CAMPEP_0119301188 /NCGR_PEP_ID=MMETSP1333-20130426/3003_1 /TAXON_ID=418940 /ORGANISM="Scyphosphaera apsteinii, Strain RCC1455" /LENGTH=288 /DNA_ID=CAMNT_0007303191 /DNA_START=170 /DNA_END=1033 /DNA_ORIENTATION=+